MSYSGTRDMIHDYVELSGVDQDLRRVDSRQRQRCIRARAEAAEFDAVALFDANGDAVMRLGAVTRAGPAAVAELYSPPRVTAALPRQSAVPYKHLRAHETVLDLVCRLPLEKQ